MRALLATIAVLLMGLTGARAQDASRGATLYQTYCAVCHGSPPSPGVGPLLAANNPALIQSAINGLVPQMSVLRFLTFDQLADIAAYIATLTAPPPPPPPPPGPPVPAFDYTDLWWGGEGESGWGFNVIQHATHVIFGVMYTYDASRHPMWFVLPGGSWTSPTTFTGKWYRVTGPAFNGAFDPARVKVVEVGTAELSFADSAHGTLAFTVDGVVVTRAITRQPF